MLAWCFPQAAIELEQLRVSTQWTSCSLLPLPTRDSQCPRHGVQNAWRSAHGVLAAKFAPMAWCTSLCSKQLLPCRMAARDALAGLQHAQASVQLVYGRAHPKQLHLQHNWCVT